MNCKKCTNVWDFEQQNADPYLCYRCGYDNQSNEYNISKLAKWWLKQKTSLKKIYLDIFNINSNKN